MSPEGVVNNKSRLFQHPERVLGRSCQGDTVPVRGGRLLAISAAASGESASRQVDTLLGLCAAAAGRLPIAVQYPPQFPGTSLLSGVRAPVPIHGDCAPPDSVDGGQTALLAAAPHQCLLCAGRLLLLADCHL